MDQAAPLTAPPTPSPPPAPAPIRGGERIDDIDVIRGLALFGVLLANLLDLFRVPFVPDRTAPRPVLPLYDRVTSYIQHLVVSGKAITTFSFLFGVGLMVFFERAQKRRPDPTRLLARRLVVLFGFGMVHAIFIWSGDILVCYAVAGLLVLPFVSRTLRTLVIGLVAITVLSELAWFAQNLPFREAAVKALGHEGLRVYSTGGYVEILRYRLRELVGFCWPLSAVILPRTMALFLLGMVAWKRGILRAPGEHKRFLGWVAVLGLVFGLAGTVLSIRVHRPHTHGGGWLEMVPDMVPQALGYVAVLLLLLQRPWWRRKLLLIAPLGRMALSNYLTHSIVWGFIFYGYGLGQMGKRGVLVTTLMGFALYFVQVAISIAWLKRYQFGPFEWAWRSLTYGRRQPMRIAAR